MKARSNAPRLALVLHLSMRANKNQLCNEGEFIPLSTLRTACAIVESLVPHTVYFWEHTIGNGREVGEHLRLAAEAIACWYGGEVMPLSDFSNSWKMWNTLSDGAQRQIINALQDMAWIAPNLPKAKLRSAGVYTQYRTNPALRELYADPHPIITPARERRKLTGAKYTQRRLEKRATQPPEPDPAEWQSRLQ
jgi:hypothetical protein